MFARVEEKISGEYAWGVLMLGVFAYDIYSIKTGKLETMSSAVYRALRHPLKFPLLSLIWGIITFHLFANIDARESLKEQPLKLKLKKGYFYE